MRLAQDLPLRRFVEIFCGKVVPAKDFIGDGERKTEKGAFRGNAPFARDLARKELEKCALPHAVPTDDPEFPIGIEMKCQILKHGRKPARVGICDMIELDIRHCVASVKKFPRENPAETQRRSAVDLSQGAQILPVRIRYGKTCAENTCQKIKDATQFTSSKGYFRRSGITSLRTRSS